VLQWVANIWNRQPLRPLAMLAIDFIGTAFDQVEKFGLGRTFLLMSGVWIWVTVFSLLANFLMKRFPDWHARIFFGAVAVIQVTVLWRSYLRESWQPGSVTLSWQLTQLFFGVFVMLMSSAFGAIRETNSSIRQTFESAVNLEELDSIARSHRLADIARESARTLHGSIQTRLIACAMEIELSTADGDQDRLRAALTEAITVLNQPLQLPIFADSLTDEIARKVGLWQAFCEFTVDVEDIDCGPTVAQLVARVVEEAISNAIRHGAAGSVRVIVRSLSPTRLEVVVSDDGRLGPVTSKGLGSAIIEQASAGDWSLTSSDCKTTLRVSIPFGD
jgi:signal transduction histidine kinase